MGMKAISVLLFILLLIGMLTLAFNIKEAKPWIMPTPCMLVYPPETVVRVGEIFDIHVTINELDVRWNMVGWQFVFYPWQWNEELELLEVREGPFMKQFPNRQSPPYTYFVLEPGPCGSYIVGCLLLPDETGNWTVFPEGNGTLVTFTFRAIASGNITFQQYNSVLVNPESEEIPHDILGGFIEVKPPIRDVAIIKIETSLTELYIGQTVNITVEIENKGTIVENLNVTAYYAETPRFPNVTIQYTPIETQTIVDLGPGENVTIVFLWDTKDVAHGNYTIKALVSILPNEANTSDNTIITPRILKIKMLGDVNGNNKIDIMDIAAAGLAFGSCPDHLRWNPQADINQDNTVDIRDLTLIAINFGKTEP